MRWLIYRVTNLLNDKKYIGITKRSLNKRLNEHKSNKKSAISKAILKYGINNFLTEQIDSASSLTEALEKESFYIRYFKSSASDHGYNIEINSVAGITTVDAKINLLSSLKEGKVSNSKNPFIGVFFSQSKKSWAFSIAFNNKKMHQAKFNNPKDAALARDFAIIELFNRDIAVKIMNFPDLYEKLFKKEISTPDRELKIANKKSRFNFVSYEKRLNQWRVRFSKALAPQIKLYYGGLFANESDAAKVADYCLARSGFKPEKLNFPKEFSNYLRNDFNLPEQASLQSKTIKYKNISLEKGSFRLYIENGPQKFRSSFKDLKQAVEARNKILISLGRKIPLNS